jgi:TetR/AcrR family fatty acid metabolism transcriptional regulator
MARAKKTSASYEERRRQLLRAATTVFARSGYVGSRVGDIAKEAGVAYGLVYHYFENKEAILNALFQENWGLVLKVVTDVHAQGGSLRDKLDVIAGFLMEAWKLQPDLVEVVMLEVVRSPKFLEKANVEAFVALLRRLEDIFAHHQGTGEVRPEVDPKLAAILLLGQLEVLLTGFVAKEFRADDDPTLLDRSRAAVVDTMLRGIGAP